MMIRRLGTLLACLLFCCNPARGEDDAILHIEDELLVPIAAQYELHFATSPTAYIDVTYGDGGIDQDIDADYDAHSLALANDLLAGLPADLTIGSVHAHYLCAPLGASLAEFSVYTSTAYYDGHSVASQILIEGFANQVPEPSSAAIALIGVGLLAAKRASKEK